MEIPNSCAVTSTDEKTDLFDATAKDLAEKIHNQFPKARSAKLDPATAASDAPRFFEELPAALKSQDLTLVKSEQSDVAVLASLARCDSS